MPRSSSLSLSQRLLAGAALTALLFAAPAADAAGFLDKLMGKGDTPKTEPQKTAPAPAAPAKEAPKAEASKPVAAEPAKEPAKTEAVHTPDSYKAGNLEISHVSATEKNGGYEIYMKITNNGKNEDGLSGAEVTDGSGEITMISKTTTQEITNKDAIDKAREASSRRPPAPPVKGEEAKAEKPKPVEIPKPEYKQTVKETEGPISVIVPGEKSATLDGSDARLILKGYKKSLKEGDVFNVMLHFRSAPNATVAVKLTNKQSLLGKVFGN